MHGIEKFNGRVIFVSRNRVILERKGILLESLDQGGTWTQIARLSAGFCDYALNQSKLTRRLFRMGVHHCLEWGRNLIIFYNKGIYEITSKGVKSLGSIRGSRPLCVCVHHGALYYGEYKPNDEREAIVIWRYTSESNQWKEAISLVGVRHVHGLFSDTFSDSIWVTTGDSDAESAIWKSSDCLETIEKVIGGNQQYRAVQLLFSQEYIYFGSDTPQERNHLYRMSRLDSSVEKLCAVSGSIFYGCRVGDNNFFSTAVEPSIVNDSQHVQVWGDVGAEWKLLSSYRKDLFSLKYLQYGQVKFPCGPGDNENLWISPMGTKNDQKTIKMPLKNFLL